MDTPNFSCLELRESADLPARTLIAPISVIREIRMILGKLNLDLQIGLDETVLVSSDLFAAFTAWQAERMDEEDCDIDIDISHWN